MSTRYAGTTAACTAATVLTTGAEVGEDTVTTEAALLLSSGDDALIVEGSRIELRALLTRALAALDDADDVALPSLVPGEDGDKAVCQHVTTAEDVQRAQEGRDAHVAAVRAQGVEPAWLPPVPVLGETCGADLVWSEDVADYRTGREWRDGALRVGDTYYGDGNGNIEVTCDAGHAWAVPEVDYL